MLIKADISLTILHLTDNSQIAGEIFSFLDLNSLGNISTISKRMRTASLDPNVIFRANFSAMKQGCLFWKHLNSRKALLQELDIEIGRHENEIVCSLLLQCNTRLLKSVKIYSKKTRLHVCPYQLGCKRVLNRLQQLSIPFPEKNKKNLCGWVSLCLKEIDIDYKTNVNTSVCSILAAKCQVTLRSLRLPGSMMEVQSGRQLQQLRTLSVGGGEPSTILEVVSLLPCLVEFIWSHGKEDFEGGPWLSGKHVLISSSLEVLDVTLTHKFFHLSIILCPKLRLFYRKGGWYGNGLLEGSAVLGMVEWRSMVLFSDQSGNLTKLNRKHINVNASYGRWEQETPWDLLGYEEEGERYYPPAFGPEKCTVISLVSLPGVCKLISHF